MPEKVDWDELLRPWHTEPEPVRENTFTPWAPPHWRAWNGHAVEVLIAEYLGELSGIMSERSGFIVIETGTGQGFVTRRLRLGNGQLWAYESDPEWSRRLQPFFTSPRWTLKGRSPSVGEMEEADLVILDSMDPFRMAEVCLWAACGKPDSVMVLHDTGSYHPTWDGHYALGTLVRTLRIGGQWLENPRGAIVVQKGQSRPETRYLTPWSRLLEQSRLRE